MKSLLLMVSLIIGLLVFPALTLAEGESPAPVPVAGCESAEYVDTDFGCVPLRSPIKFAVYIYNIGLGLIGGVGLLSIMYGGYLVMTSRGDAYQIKQGQRYIYYAIGGIVLAFLGLAVYQIIGGDVLRIPGFTSPSS